MEALRSNPLPEELTKGLKLVAQQYRPNSAICSGSNSKASVSSKAHKKFVVALLHWVDALIDNAET